MNIFPAFRRKEKKGTDDLNEPDGMNTTSLPICFGRLESFYKSQRLLSGKGEEDILVRTDVQEGKRVVSDHSADRRGLYPVHACIAAAHGEELIVCASFSHTAVFYDQDLIRVPDRG